MASVHIELWEAASPGKPVRIGCLAINWGQSANKPNHWALTGAQDGNLSGSWEWRWSPAGYYNLVLLYYDSVALLTTTVYASLDGSWDTPIGGTEPSIPWFSAKHYSGSISILGGKGRLSLQSFQWKKR